MKKTLIAGMLVATIACFARPHHHHHHHYHRGSDGVWLAAGIVNLVAGGLRIINPPRAVIVQQPVYQVVPQPIQVIQPVAPVQITTPVVTTPVVIPTTTYVAPQPIIVPQRPVLIYRYQNGMEVYRYR